MNEPLPVGLLFVYVLSIALSLIGGLLIGYFVGRTRNGQAEDLVVLEAKMNVLTADLEGLHADMARLGVEPPEAQP